MLGYGQDIVSARRFAFLSLGQLTANSTVAAPPRFGCPPGVGKVRVLGLHVAASAVPVDADGTCKLNVKVNDISEGQADVLVNGFDLESLDAANELFELEVAESTEKELTLEAGDVLYAELVNDSAAIDTNANITLVVEYILLPRLQSEEDEPSYVRYPSSYAA